MFKRKHIFKGSIFHCYISLPECIWNHQLVKYQRLTGPSKPSIRKKSAFRRYGLSLPLPPFRSRVPKGTSVQPAPVVKERHPVLDDFLFVHAGLNVCFVLYEPEIEDPRNKIRWRFCWVKSIKSMGRLCIYLHEWLIFFLLNVEKHTSPMDSMGYITNQPKQYILETPKYLKIEPAI